MTGAITRGLSLSDFSNMTIGQLVDYCITYNDLSTPSDKKKKKPKVREANQTDYDNF